MRKISYKHLTRPSKHLAKILGTNRKNVVRILEICSKHPRHRQPRVKYHPPRYRQPRVKYHPRHRLQRLQRPEVGQVQHLGTFNHHTHPASLSL